MWYHPRVSNPPGGPPPPQEWSSPWGAPESPPPPGPALPPEPQPAASPWATEGTAAAASPTWTPGYGPPPKGTNVLAIVSLVCAVSGVFTCISAPVGAVLGHVARRQIAQNGEQGAGLALAGIITGWALTGLGLLVCGAYGLLLFLTF